MSGTQDRFKDLIATYNEVSAGTLRGVEGFCRLRQIQAGLRQGYLDPERDSSYEVLNTTRQQFNSLLCSQYFLAARQLYEGATDEHFLGANRAISESLSDLHLVPVYMELGKQAVGDKGPVVTENWQAIGTSKEEYDSLVRKRQAIEAKRVWGLAQTGAGDYHSFTSIVHEVGVHLRLAGLNVPEESAYQALGTTKEQCDAFLAQRQQKEQAQWVCHKIARATL